MTITAPERSMEQRLVALKQANSIRIDRARMKRDLKDGTVHVSEILISPPAYALTMKVADLLMALPKFGGMKTNRTLLLARISHTKTVGGLSARQRGELTGILA